MSDRIYVIPAAISNPLGYRAEALKLEFGTVDVGAQFHGIAFGSTDRLHLIFKMLFPGLQPNLSFFRKSPEGQTEPNYIHTDCDMGEWTAIHYLTPDPPPDDGTTFWRHRPSGRIETTSGATSEDNLDETLAWRDRAQWEPWRTVPADFNTLVIFPATYYHSRAIEANYGTGDSARLIQVVFGTGQVPQEQSCR